ncbi:MAG: hypothetical protein E6Q97_15750 [Desulfurellales bacterium]|nr:MAG: hypothetical protein E6Q97_15750 [Desulfurellales bacterium]
MNALTLNRATMIDALQEYLHKRWDRETSGVECPEVMSVEYDQKECAFVIQIKEAITTAD